MAGSIVTGGLAQTAHAAPADIKINEVESQAGSPDDWIELINAGSTDADVSGLVLSDNSDDHKWSIPAGTTIPDEIGRLVWWFQDGVTAGALVEGHLGEGATEPSTPPSEEPSTEPEPTTPVKRPTALPDTGV